MPKGKLESELSSIKDMAIWKEYLRRAGDYRNTQAANLMTCSLDKVDRVRGILEGMDYLLRLPDTIVSAGGGRNNNDEGEQDNG